MREIFPRRRRLCHRPYSRTHLPNLRGKRLFRKGRRTNPNQAQKQCRTHMPPGQVDRDGTTAQMTRLPSDSQPLLPNVAFWTASKLELQPLLFPAVSSGPRTVSQHQNTMAAKDGAGPRPAAHRAKRCFLKCLETIELQPLLFPAVSSGPRTVSQHQNTMAAKDGAGPRPAAHRAKRCFLKCLETKASTLAFSCRQPGSKDGVAAPKHHGSEGRSGPAAGSPSCQTLLSEVPRN